MAKISPHKLRAVAECLGFDLTVSVGKKRTYKLTLIGGYGPEFSGSYDRVRCFLLGLDWHKADVESKYHLLRK